MRRSAACTAGAQGQWVGMMAHDLAYAVGIFAGPDLPRVTVALLRRKIFTVPLRLVRAARGLQLRPSALTGPVGEAW